ncbi:MAG: hypothetical protein H7210_07515 [Pyrinomonadaceae bacterium]|nr:hypothetical protein [Phycisphaerales bacterium]
MATKLDSENAVPGVPFTGVHSPADASAGATSSSLASPPPLPPPRPQFKLTLCPYCGHESGSAQQCEKCRGLFEPLSRQASQNAMGPWFLRDDAMAFRPGFSYETLRLMVSRGRVTRDSILRGPTTRQFWMRAGGVPGVSHLLGVCHACQNPVSPKHTSCPACGTSFEHESDRQYLGLGEIHLLPGQASPEQVAASSFRVVAAAGLPKARRNDERPLSGHSRTNTDSQAMAPASEAPRGPLSGVGAREVKPMEPPGLNVHIPDQRPTPASMKVRIIVVFLILIIVLLTAVVLTAFFGPREWLETARGMV